MGHRQLRGRRRPAGLSLLPGRNAMNRTLIIAAAALAGLLAVGCQGQSQGQKIENKAQAQDTLSLETNQPVPHYNWSQYRQTVIDSETIAANGTQTTSFFFNLGVRDPIFSCPSIGVPVPNTASLTNPDQVVTQDSQGNGISGAATIGQMDPYGAYNPTASEGTFVICVTTWSGRSTSSTGKAPSAACPRRPCGTTARTR